MAISTKAPVAISLKNILFTTDFSACSDTAIIFAKALARRYGSKLVLGHVVAPLPYFQLGAETVPTELDHGWQNAGECMTAFINVHGLRELPHEVALETGPFWPAIANILEQRQIDLIVVGTHGREGLKKLLLGSVAEEIFRRASCPVLTIGPDVTAGPALAAEFREVLFATDLSPHSEKALPYAVSLVNENRGRLTLLHVVQESSLGMETGYPAAQVAAARQELLAMVTDLDLWCEPELYVDVGIPADTILQVARDKRVNLIVMGVRHSGAPVAASHVPWRTAHQVVCHAPCPVLTVRSNG
jgi:nucleotide-binding universal stress UspA family protein